MYEPVLPPDVPRPLDEELLAWAAGFFDGEGSTIARNHSRRPHYKQLVVSVPQSGRDATPPDVLVRFRTAVLGMGEIVEPNAEHVWVWRSRGRVDGELTLALLWPYLGAVKRAQAVAALEGVELQYTTLRRRPPRYVPQLVPHPIRSRAELSGDVERAWAAGFLDAEGYFGTPKRYVRKDGTIGLCVRASATQHGSPRVPADVLLRLQRLLGGRIQRHGEEDTFKWVVEGLVRVCHVVDRLAPWLGPVKSEQAAAALSAAASVRIRGTSERCKRGHLYDGLRVAPDGGVHQTCTTCERILDHEQRRASGRDPRAVRSPPDDATRRYRVKF